MRNLLTICMVFFGFTAVDAQADFSTIEQDVVIEKINKNTEIAFVYQNDVLVEKGPVVNGKREGVWQSFDSNGALVAEASFSKGMKNGVWNIYDGEDLKYVLHYQNGARVQANNIAIHQE